MTPYSSGQIRVSSPGVLGANQHFYPYPRGYSAVQRGDIIAVDYCPGFPVPFNIILT